jgi:hypothetical protein
MRSGPSSASRLGHHRSQRDLARAIAGPDELIWWEMMPSQPRTRTASWSIAARSPVGPVAGCRFGWVNKEAESEVGRRGRPTLSSLGVGSGTIGEREYVIFYLNTRLSKTQRGHLA